MWHCHVKYRAVQSAHKASDSDSSIFKSPAPTSTPTPTSTLTPTLSYKLSMYYMIPVHLLKWKNVSWNISSTPRESSGYCLDLSPTCKVKGPAADATGAPQPWGFLCNPVMKMTMFTIIFCPFASNGAPVEWNWQGKTEVLGEKPVPVPLCAPQIPRGLTQDRTRASAVGGRRLTAWAMARP
jgi:hypothetical protein